jgi:hypothetical protein
LKIWRQNGWGTTLMYENSVSTASGALMYTVAENMTGNTYIAEGIIDPQYDWSIFAHLSKAIGIKSKWGDTVILGTMLLVIVCAFIFLDLGIAGVVSGSVAALGLASFLGFITLPIGGLVSLIILGAILIARANRTQ